MGQLGVSIYPEQTSFEENKRYLDLAAKYGYKRIFMSLLEIKDGKNGVIEKFKKIIEYANTLNFKVILDINPSLFKQLGISYDDLSFFNDLGVWGIRLDEGFTGLEEARMTRNPFNLKIEINMSAGTHYIDNIMSYDPNTDNLLGCHNFYPQRYTGLGDAFFNKWSKVFADHNLVTAAFISSQNAQIGPWPVSEGLPTLEKDRDLPIDTQVRHLLSSGLINDILIGNAFASEEDLEKVASVFNSSFTTIKVDLEENISDLEKEIALNNIHLYRGDASEYLIRDTQTRVKYENKTIPQKNTTDISFGDVIIVNDEYNRYKGEVQIALCDIKNDGRRNIIGKISDDEKFLIPTIKPWSQFKLIKG
ncbi:DUF871 domain-containing protein [Companilactobacillus sp. DQM5]|uniref:DUF871 domain-containing protein n=1 Tax=Companilactobacillus sp. DQM5 TaxID=3463359 RepID=UPI00405865F4